MPRVKQPKLYEPPWKEWDFNANKRGLHHTFYLVNGDQYTGDWLDNKKHGKGTQKWAATGLMYQGDWKNGRRNGFGVLSCPDKSTGKYRREYSGGWKNDKKHGYGTYYYSDDHYYEGHWFADNRSGWGRMYYPDGSIYEGEWYGDVREGRGMHRLANDNRYEGEWRADMKNGRGKFYFLDNGQLLEGVWVNDIAKCGEMQDFDRAAAPEPTPFPIPNVTLADPESVLANAEEEYLSDDDV